MRRIARIVAVVAVALICLAAAANWVLEERWRHDVIVHGEGLYLDTTAEVLERNVRSSIPLGSTRQPAEEALQHQGLRFSYDLPSRTLYTGARALKGSNWLTQSGVSILLRFDADERLTGIESRVENTGP